MIYTDDTLLLTEADNRCLTEIAPDHGEKTDDGHVSPTREWLDLLARIPAKELDGLFVLPGNATDIEDSQTVLRYDPFHQGKMSTTNLVGFLGSDDGSLRLSISSRFSMRNGNAVPLQEDYFLAYLMGKVMHVDLLAVDLTTKGRDAWERLLMLMFPYYLRRALDRGLYRQYVRRDHNDSRLRGALDAARHLRMNTPFVGNAAYCTRDFSSDNDMTQLIRHTIEQMCRKGAAVQSILHQNDIRTLVRTIRQVTQEHYLDNDRRKIVEANLRHPIIHPLYEEYRDLQRLCLMILQRRGLPNEHDGKGLHGILFDCAWLWEEYLNTLLREAPIIECRHPRNKDKEGQQHFFVSNGRKVGKIYPDFLWRRKETPNSITVGDAKYKPASNISGDDYKQVISYMYRFGSKEGYYLYPYSSIDDVVDNDERGLTRDSEDLRCIHMDLGAGWDDGNEEKQAAFVEKLGLNVRVPDDCSFTSYCSLMEHREKTLLKRIVSSDDISK